jgi:hypothetical protein
VKLALAGLVVVPCFLLLPAPPEDSVVFAVASGTSVRKSIDCSMELELDGVLMTLGDQELPEAMAEAFDISFSEVDTYVVLDEYRAVADGRPKELLRSFETLEEHEVNHRSMPGSEPEDTDETRESELVGHTLRFAWNEESESYDVTWVGEAGDEELLAGLEEDMDMRALLPGGPVSAGDTWELECKAVLGAMPPGGRLGFPEDDEDEFDFEEAFEGTAGATYAGIREEDGVRLAVIEIELEGKAETTKEEEGATQEFVLAVECDYELLWDLAAGHARSLEVTGGIGAAILISSKVEVEGQVVPLEIEIELSGEIEMSAVFERE